MATRLTKPVAREIEGRDGRTRIVTLTPFGVVIREKGRRKGPAPVTIEEIESVGYKKEAAARLAERTTEQPRKVRRSVV